MVLLSLAWSHTVGVGVQVDKESNYILHLYVQYIVEEGNGDLSCVFLSILFSAALPAFTWQNDGTI